MAPLSHADARSRRFDAPLVSRPPGDDHRRPDASGPGDSIDDAARALSARSIGGAPVVDDDGRVVGLLEDDDLIVQESRLHFPTVISVLGAYIELPSSVAHFEADLRKAVGATVGDVMDADPATCGPDDTLEQVATVMHEQRPLPPAGGVRRTAGGHRLAR